MSLLTDIFTYAFRGSGKYILVTCAVLSLVTDIVSFVPILGLIAVVLLAGYFCALYFEVIETTATGSEEAPGFPDLSNVVSDILWPFLKTVAVAFLSFSPLIAYQVANGGSPQITLLLLGQGLVYFPMAMLASVVLGTLTAVSPHIVIPSIFRAGGLYWLAVFMLLLLYMGRAFAGDLLGRIPILGWVIAALIGAYVLLTNGRMLGVLYRERQEELNWL